MRKGLYQALLQITILIFLISGCNNNYDPSYHIGILGGLGEGGAIIDGFIDGMSELGYIRDDNIFYDIQTPGFDFDAYRVILSKFISTDIDLVYVYPTEAAVVAKRMLKNKNIPVVFSVSFTEDSGLIDSLISPGEDIAGVRYPGPDITLKRYEILKSLIPEMKDLIVVYQEEGLSIDAQLEQLQKFADENHVTIHKICSCAQQTIVEQLEERICTGSTHFDAILLPVSPFSAEPNFYSCLNRISEEEKIPYGGQYNGNITEDSLFRVGIDFYKTGLQAATLADKILRGTLAEELPVLSSNLFVSINYFQATKMGLEVPVELLLQADEIIQE